LGYFTEGAMREPEEEVVLEPTEDKAVVFEEFFAARINIPLRSSLLTFYGSFG
jgi:hypothetical protein